MIVDYGKLPTGKTLLRNLLKGYSNVLFDFDSKNTHCIVKGRFTELQAFSRDLMGSLNLKSQAAGEILLPDSSHVARETSKHDHQQVPDSTKPVQDTKLPIWEQVCEMAAQVPPPRGPVDGEAVEHLEDFTLVMDSDIYLYMQRFCAAEYQGVLRQHRVDVVDVLCDGITILYLQPPAGVSGDSDVLQQAHLALQQLYHQLEVSLRKEKITKRGLDMDCQALRAVVQELQELYPQVLCHEDEKQLYLIGNLVDVSQAKQYLQNLSTRRGVTHALGTLSSSLPSHPTTSHTTEAAQRKPKAPADTSASRLSPGRPEPKGEFKLAANFSTLKAEGSQASGGLLQNQGSPLVRQAQLSGKRSSETDALGPSAQTALTQQHQPQVSTADVDLGSAAESQQKDPKEQEYVKGTARLTRHKALSPFEGKEDSILQRPWDSRGSGPVKQQSLTSTPSASSALDSKHSESRTPRRRSNSFSLPRSQESNKPQDTDTAGSGGSGMSAEMSLDSLQWSYLKDVCHAAIDQLCKAGGVQISEHHAGDSTVLTLRAADSSRLLQAKWKVEALVQKCPDLVCQSMSYSELAVDGPDDSALSELCSLLRANSLQVGLSKDKHRLHLACPKAMLPGVTEAFQVFNSRRLRALKSSSLSPGLKSTGHSGVIQPGRSQNMLLEALQSDLQHLNISDKADHADVLRPAQLPQAEEKRSPSPGRFQQALEQSDSTDRVDSGTGQGGGNLPSPGVVDKPSPAALRESQEQPKRKVAVGEGDTARRKQVLPDRFQFARDKSRGGPSEVLGQRHLPVSAAEAAPRSLPPWLYGAVAAEPLQAVPHLPPAAEPRGQEQALVPAGRSSGQEEPDLASWQAGGPSPGQESSKATVGRCDACQGSGVTCQAPCGHALCRTCFAADSTQPACCSSSSVATSHKISGTFKVSSLSQSLPGYYRDPTLQVVYSIPDGVQGVGTHREGFPIPMWDMQ